MYFTSGVPDVMGLQGSLYFRGAQDEAIAYANPVPEQLNIVKIARTTLLFHLSHLVVRCIFLAFIRLRAIAVMEPRLLFDCPSQPFTTSL